VLVSIWKTEKS